MTFKKMRKIASRSGFSLSKSRINPYNYVLRDNRTRVERHYCSLDDVLPDIDEINEGGMPF